jgi:hypothetical protein
MTQFGARLLVSVAALVAAVLLLVAFVSEGSALPRGPTYMYVGDSRHEHGTLENLSVLKGGVLDWGVNGNCDYSSGYAEMSRSRDWINVHFMDDSPAGFSRRVSSGHWAIYGLYGGRRHLLGEAVQRSASRWDVLEKGRQYGRPYGGAVGTPAAAALLLLCA